MTRRNFQDSIGYPQVAWDEANPWLAGLIGGGVIVAASIWAMPAPSAPARSGGLRPEPISVVSALPAPAAIAEGGAR